jgi:hypothetical protein
MKINKSKLKRRKLTKYFEKKNKDGTIIMNDLN